jgi:hypothetical protein
MGQIYLSAYIEENLSGMGQIYLSTYIEDNLSEFKELHFRITQLNAVLDKGNKALH